VNRDEHEEEERNNYTNGHDIRKEEHREDNHQEDGSREDNHREQRSERVDIHGNRQENAGDLSKIIVELERRAHVHGD
jgi:hypothetical protein